jgi:hypothetical protein
MLCVSLQMVRATTNRTKKGRHSCHQSPCNQHKKLTHQLRCTCYNKLSIYRIKILSHKFCLSDLVILLQTHLGCWTVSIPTAGAKHKFACRPLWGSGWHRCACRGPWCCTTGYCWWGCWASHTGNRGSGVFCRLSIQPSPCPTEKTELWLFNLRSRSWNSSNQTHLWVWKYANILLQRKNV